MPEFELTRRALTLPEAVCLHEELKSTPNILGYTVRELLRFSDVLVAAAATIGSESENSVFAGACLSKDLLFNWTDIAVLYVLPAFRGSGLSTLLYEAAFSHARKRKRHIYTLSRSPQVIHLMERQGMAITSSMCKAPLAVHLYMNCHMMSVYRLREGGRKVKMRKKDGSAFVAGIKRADSKS